MTAGISLVCFSSLPFRKALRVYFVFICEHLDFNVSTALWRCIREHFTQWWHFIRNLSLTIFLVFNGDLAAHKKLGVRMLTAAQHSRTIKLSEQVIFSTRRKKGLMVHFGKLCSLAKFMYFLYNYFLCLPSGSFHLIPGPLLPSLHIGPANAAQLSLTVYEICFNCPLSIL